MNWTVAVTAVDVKWWGKLQLANARLRAHSFTAFQGAVRTDAGRFGQRGRKGQQIVGRASAEGAFAQSSRPGGVQLVGDDQIDAALLQQAGGGPHDGYCGFRRGQAIHDGANAHVAELLVVLPLRVQQDGPSAGGSPAEVARAA